MSSRLLLLALVSLATIVAVVGLGARPVAAHNTLQSSEPADGATLTTPPTQITWRFDRAVPLDTMTVTLIDASGARTELLDSTHDPGGDTEVITPLPPLPSGATSIRWRLVGPDGHPITGRVDLTVSAAATTATAATGVTTTSAVTPTSSSSQPTTASDLAAGPDADTDDDAAGAGSFSTPGGVRWLLRYGSYLAIMAAVGVFLTTAFVWAGAGAHVGLRRLLVRSLLAVAGLALPQLLVVASDVSGDAPWSSAGSIDPALSTHAGMALALRIVLALGLVAVVTRDRDTNPEVVRTAASLGGLALLGTWAFAGHARSMRWPELGVAADVAHHAAAAAWIAGLAIVGWILMPTAERATVVDATRRLSRVSAISVAVLVVTGIVQTWRLVGNPADLLDAAHGRYLAVKLVALAVMLGVAAGNRRRVRRLLDDTHDADGHVGRLRQAVVVEFAIGMAIVGVTAAMVVSPPSASEVAVGFSTNVVYYTL